MQTGACKSEATQMATGEPGAKVLAGTAAGWRAICEDTRGGSGAGEPIKYDADFVIMSNGNFSRPSLPRTYQVRLLYPCPAHAWGGVKMVQHGACPTSVNTTRQATVTWSRHVQLETTRQLGNLNWSAGHGALQGQDHPGPNAV